MMEFLAENTHLPSLPSSLPPSLPPSLRRAARQEAKQAVKETRAWARYDRWVEKKLGFAGGRVRGRWWP